MAIDFWGLNCLFQCGKIIFAWAVVPFNIDHIF